MSSQITSTADVINALGGTKAACALLGVKEQAVSVWRVNNTFPSHTFPKIQGELLRLGKTADVALWRFERKPRGDAA